MRSHSELTITNVRERQLVALVTQLRSSPSGVIWIECSEPSTQRFRGDNAPAREKRRKYFLSWCNTMGMMIQSITLSAAVYDADYLAEDIFSTNLGIRRILSWLKRLGPDPARNSAERFSTLQKAIANELRYQLVCSGETNTNPRPRAADDLVLVSDGYLDLREIFIGRWKPLLDAVYNLHRGTREEIIITLSEWWSSGALSCLHTLGTLGRAPPPPDSDRERTKLDQFIDRISTEPQSVDDELKALFAVSASKRGIAATYSEQSARVPIKLSGRAATDAGRDIGGKNILLTPFRQWCMQRCGEVIPNLTPRSQDIFGRPVTGDSLPIGWESLPVWAVLYRPLTPLDDIASEGDECGADGLPIIPIEANASIGDLLVLFALMDICPQYIELKSPEGEVILPEGGVPVFGPDAALPYVHQVKPFPAQAFTIAERGFKVRCANTHIAAISVFLGAVGSWKTVYAEAAWTYDDKPDVDKTFVELNKWLISSEFGREVSRKLFDANGDMTILSVDLSTASDDLHPELLEIQTDCWGSSLPHDHWYHRVYKPMALGQRTIRGSTTEARPCLRGTLLGDRSSFTEMSDYFQNISWIADHVSGTRSYTRNTGDDLLRIACAINNQTFREMLKRAGSSESVYKSFLSTRAGIYLEAPFIIVPGDNSVVFEKVDAIKARQLTFFGNIPKHEQEVSSLNAMHYLYTRTDKTGSSYCDILSEFQQNAYPELLRYRGVGPITMEPKLGGLGVIPPSEWEQELHSWGPAIRALVLLAANDQNSVISHWCGTHLDTTPEGRELRHALGDEGYDAFLSAFGLWKPAEIAAYLSDEECEISAEEFDVYTPEEQREYALSTGKVLEASDILKTLSAYRYTVDALNGNYVPDEEPPVASRSRYVQRWKKVKTRFQRFISSHGREYCTAEKSVRTIMDIFPTKMDFRIFLYKGVRPLFLKKEVGLLADFQTDKLKFYTEFPPPGGNVVPDRSESRLYRGIDDKARGTPGRVTRGQIHGPASSLLEDRVVIDDSIEMGPSTPASDLIRRRSADSDSLPAFPPRIRGAKRPAPESSGSGAPPLRRQRRGPGPDDEPVQRKLAFKSNLITYLSPR